MKLPTFTRNGDALAKTAGDEALNHSGRTRSTQAGDYWTGRVFTKAARTKRVIRAEATRRNKLGVKVHTREQGVNAFMRHNLREVITTIALVAAAAIATKAYTDAKARQAPCVTVASALNFGCGR